MCDAYTDEYEDPYDDEYEFPQEYSEDELEEECEGDDCLIEEEEEEDEDACTVCAVNGECATKVSKNDANAGVVDPPSPSLTISDLLPALLLMLMKSNSHN